MAWSLAAGNEPPRAATASPCTPSGEASGATDSTLFLRQTLAVTAQKEKIFAALDLPAPPPRRARRQGNRRDLTAVQRRQANNRDSARYRRGLAEQSGEQVKEAVLALQARVRAADQHTARMESQCSFLESLVANEQAQCTLLRRQVTVLEVALFDARQTTASAVQTRLAARGGYPAEQPAWLQTLPPSHAFTSPPAFATNDHDHAGGSDSSPLTLTMPTLDEALDLLGPVPPLQSVSPDLYGPPEPMPSAVPCPTTSVSTRTCRSVAPRQVAAALSDLAPGRHLFLPRQ